MENNFADEKFASKEPSENRVSLLFANIDEGFYKSCVMNVYYSWIDYNK